MKSISELENKLEELPLLPTVVVRLLALDSNDENYFEHVLQLSQEDPTFALRIIRLSNSATELPSQSNCHSSSCCYKAGRKINSRFSYINGDNACIYPQKPWGEKSMETFFTGSNTARVIAKSATRLKVNPEHAFLCGLLHGYWTIYII